MNHAFIETANARNFKEICDELSDEMSMIGSSMAMATGQAGRGKTEAARQYAVNTDAIYIPPMVGRTVTSVFREITFELASMRPGRQESCVEVIGGEMSKRRRLIIIDEADLLATLVLEGLRNLNERCACPIILIGEEMLKGRIASRRRLSSRVRRRMEFGPVGQHDIAFYFRQAFNLKSVAPEIIAPVNKHAAGDWRPVLNVAVGIDRAMRASNVTTVTPEMVSDVIKNT